MKQIVWERRHKTDGPSGLFATRDDADAVGSVYAHHFEESIAVERDVVFVVSEVGDHDDGGDVVVAVTTTFELAESFVERCARGKTQCRAHGDYSIAVFELWEPR